MSFKIRATAFNSSNFFIRHQNGEGEINEFDPPHAVDFIFDVVEENRTVNGIEVPTLRFRGTGNFNRHFLRHKNYRILLEKQPNTAGPALDLFMKDSTFFHKGALSDIFGDDGSSFESINFPNHFIRHRDSHLFINTDLNTPLDKRDATFKLEGA